MTYTPPVRQPPLRPRIAGSKVAISCHKPGEFLIRAWAPLYGGPERLVDWICHYVGRMDMAELEWWGYTYYGQPAYMQTNADDRYRSGLTIQHFVEPADAFTRTMLDDGRLGPAYGKPHVLEIPEKGVVQ